MDHLSEILNPADFWEVHNAEKNTVKCLLCAQYCVIGKDRKGICGVRMNNDGILYSLSWGNVMGTALDPIEKKPFYHFKPGTQALSFGTPGCNFKCLNCQNYSLSQSVKTMDSFLNSARIKRPDYIIRQALMEEADGIAYTYSEPVIFFEYARDIIRECKSREDAAHLYHVFVSNGYFSNELIDSIVDEKLLDAVNIDLKFMDSKKYRSIAGASPKPVMNSIKRLWMAGIHIEVINLVIPGENDTAEDFRQLTSFLALISTDIPLHFSRFYPTYKMPDKPETPIETLLLAKEIALEAGIKYVYMGNTNYPGANDTKCHSCREILIKRNSYKISGNTYKSLINKNICPVCGTLLYIKV